ncbi:MAG: hypothetical protein ACPG6V_12235 [Flavobacteriales bacterium]
MRYPLIVLISILLFSCQKTELDKERIIGIGKKLTQTELTQSDYKQILDIVIIGDDLMNKMTELQKNATEFEFGIKSNDLRHPFGNDKADGILTIRTDYKNIGIRLKYDDDLDKYHILGWMTLLDDLK